ncbi:MAG: adenylate kinase [Candidatus Omnitrophica bacterium]|nr:adenylate kinase [Candidatus Omnitrophota bacterium]
MNIVLLGPPGAGKGTQAEILKDAFKLLHLSTGDMFREEVKAGSEIGKKLAEYMNKGELVPDKIVTDLVIGRMGKPDAKSGVILDGYPRTGAQAESLDKALKDSGKRLDVVLYVNTTDEVVVKRLSGRRICKACGKIFHVVNMPSKKENVCDICGGELYQREDDKPATIKNRLEVYVKSTKDLIKYYRDKGFLYEFDGGMQKEDLFKAVKALFNKLGLLNK